MKTAEVISRLNSKCGWNLKNNGGFSHTQLMIIEDTHIIVTKEIKDMIDEMIEKYKKKAENYYSKDLDWGSNVEKQHFYLQRVVALTELRGKL